jgi:hypothetical protein
MDVRSSTAAPRHCLHTRFLRIVILDECIAWFIWREFPMYQNRINAHTNWRLLTIEVGEW